MVTEKQVSDLMSRTNSVHTRLALISSKGELLGLDEFAASIGDAMCTLDEAYAILDDWEE